MSEFEERLTRASSHLDVAWTAERAHKVRQAVDARLRRDRRAWRWAFATCATATVCACAVAGFWTLRRAPTSAAAAAAPASDQLRLADGSTVTRLDADSVVIPVTVSAERTVLAFDRGAVRVSVAHDPHRQFRVETGSVAIEVVGTQFTAKRIGAAVEVAVEQGRVRVTWDTSAALLGPGERGLYPPPLDATAPVSAGGETTAPSASSLDGESPASKEPGIKTPPRRTESVAKPERAEPAAAPDPVDRLLDAADRARLERRLEHAVSALEEIVRNHGADPRAALASFTLGRILLEDLRRPADAASSFARAHALAPQGPFAEDALAREVEAYARAGDPQRAQARAEDYLRAYPRGRRLRAVRLHGRLE